MKWEDVGMVLSARKFSERDAIVTVLTREHGLWRAMVKGALSHKHRALYEPGNLLLARWNARLAEHMGNFSCELLEQNAAMIMQDKLSLSMLGAMTALLEGCFEERDPHPVLFEWVKAMVEMLAGAGTPAAEIWKRYALFEKFLLAEAGYGLDLSRCAATGGVENLVYISPKTGRAVSAEAGAPYHGRMLSFPRLYKEEGFMPKSAETLDALRVSGYFLTHWLYAPRDRNLPPVRQRLVEWIEKECLLVSA